MNNKKIFIFIALVFISIVLGAGTFYLSKQMSIRLPEIFQAGPYPSDFPHTEMCGNLWKCNGTRPIGGKTIPGATVHAEIACTPYAGGPCCLMWEDRPEGCVCTSKADCCGSCEGIGSCTISLKQDCACGGIGTIFAF